MNRILTAVIILFNILAYPHNADIDIRDVAVFYEFGSQITFQAHLDPISQVNEVYFFIQPEGQNTRVGLAQLAQDGNVFFSYDTQQDPFEPFAWIDYWMLIVLENQEEIESPHYKFCYEDNRFQWKTLEDDQFIVHWYDRDIPFGQTVLNISHQALDSAMNILSVSLPGQVDIYVYGSSIDLQTAIQTTQRTWIAGQANPSSSLILISVPPGPSQGVELERQIPHELVHLLEYQIAGEQYDNLPAWLSEGLASMAELNPNSEYQRVLLSSSRDGSLLSFSNLCQSFPREASSAYLAYAQSSSFTKFLHDTYGSSGIQSLIFYYKDGLGCEEGIEASFGTDLSRLESRWQQEVLGVQAGFIKMKTLAPYLLLMGIVVVVPILPFLPRHKKKED